MLYWKKAIIKNDYTLKSAVNNLNKSGLKICLVENYQKKFIGTITDGDIRRGLLKNIKLNDKINKIVNKKCNFVNKSITKSAANQIMKDKNIMHLPIIEKNSIKGLHILNSKNNAKRIIKETFVIMAGGRGLRLKPITNKIPKPMIKVNNKPMMEHIIVNAREEGFRNFIIIVHHLKDKIKKYFKNGSNFGVKISYIDENFPLGTAGGLSLLEKKITENFFLSNSDVFSEFKYSDMLNYHKINKSKVTLAIKILGIRESYGLVTLNGNKIKNFMEKPITKKYINCGVYAFNKNIIKQLKKNQKVDMITFLKKLKIKKYNILAYPVFENWTDLGIKKNLKRINI